ncbi:MAG: tRNA pseudouridine(38-40) synthase TruA [Clostridia bacterium]|nr:tRNA pseudouridine(38-40) synthase TruA [Clostridia bacterium]
MKNYKITAEYDGTKYNGWQRQGNTKNTIAERFENVLSRMCGKDVEVFASGRTDAGVHADEQTANFKCDTLMTEPEIQDYLNKYLPEDIRVTSIEEVDMRFHSRLNAVSKTYEYTIATEKPDVFIRKYVYFANRKPDIEKMKKAAMLITGKHDFRGFSSLGRTKKSTVRTVNFIEIEEEEGLIKIRINGDGFLYNMVRIIAGTLYDIGCDALDESVIEEIFEEKIRERAGVTLPASGLRLVKVYY